MKHINFVVSVSMSAVLHLAFEPEDGEGLTKDTVINELNSRFENGLSIEDIIDNIELVAAHIDGEHEIKIAI